MEFKVGDIVKDSRNSISRYNYCEITRFGELLNPEECGGEEGVYKVWGYWACSLRELKNKRYSNREELWCPSNILEFAEEENKRIIKPYGIVNFMKSINK